MRTVKGLYEDKDTYFVSDYVVNGCQVFHISQVDKIPFSFDRELVKKLSSDNFAEFGEDEDWYSIANHESPRIASVAAAKGHYLDLLMERNRWQINEKLAKYKRFSEKLSLNSYEEVRYEVASNGYCLGRLVHDYSSEVKMAVARAGGGLNILINDESHLVRRQVARLRHGLHILVNDRSALVRAEVARRGYCLETLVNDKSPEVRLAAQVSINKIQGE